MFLSKAKELNMNLVYLPPYSPDLNPIEYIWKSVKRVLSEKNFKSR
jgi:transposase